MTDKQIIIDGCDVSGCDCFITQMDFPNNLEGGYYNQNNLCECGIQGVESYPFFCKDNPNCYYKQLKRKEQECEELIKINKANAKSYEKFWYKLESYKQTLAEIKEIADKENNDIKVLYNRRTYQRMKQILQKIRECEVINER